MNVIEAMAARDEMHRETLERIGQEIGYGRAQQMLGELWDAMLDREYPSPAGVSRSSRGRMGVTTNLHVGEVIIGPSPLGRVPIDQPVRPLWPERKEGSMKISDDMVSRFLTWPVPAEVYPDGEPGKPGRTGTNLLSAPQARAMLEHVLGVAESPMTREWCAAFPGSAAWIINEFARRIDARDAELKRLRTALRFYARGEHYTLDEAEEFDTVSGEPQNWLCSGREESSTMVENGRVALFALQGIDANWIDGGEDNTPQPVEGEVTCAT